MTQPDGQSPAAHTKPTPAQPDGTADKAAPTRSGRLLGLVRKLIDYGKQLITTLQQPGAADRLFDLATRFGTLDIAMIIARITRGLMRAAALEQRVSENAARIDKPRPAPARARSDAKPRPRPRAKAKAKPSASPADIARALLARMPTEEEIAAQVRRHPIGAVIADICSDLGICYDHPLWQEIQDAVMEHGGPFIGLMQDVFERIRLTNFVPPDTPFDEAELQRWRLSATPRTAAAAAGTGPP